MSSPVNVITQNPQRCVGHSSLFLEEKEFAFVQFWSPCNQSEILMISVTAHARFLASFEMTRFWDFLRQYKY